MITRLTRLTRCPPGSHHRLECISHLLSLCCSGHSRDIIHVYLPTVRPAQAKVTGKASTFDDYGLTGAVIVEFWL